MATSASDGSGFSVVSGASWASTANAYDGSATTYATLTTTTAGSHVVDITGYAFAGVVSAGSTLSSVVANVSQYVASATRWNNPTVQAYVGSTAIGSATTLTERTTAGNEDVTLTGVTLADVLSADFKVRFTANKSGTTSSVQNLGWANVTVTFTGPSVTDDNGLTDGVAVLQTVTQSDAGVGLTHPAPTVNLTAGAVSHTRTVTDAEGLTDSRALARRVQQADAEGLTGDPTVITGASQSRTVTDTTDLADSMVVSRTSTVADAGIGITGGPSVTGMLGARTITDSLGVADSNRIGRAAAQSDALGLADSTSVVKGTGQARTVTDAEDLGDGLLVAPTTVVSAVGIGITGEPTAAKSSGTPRTVTDPVALADSTSVVKGTGQARTVTDAEDLGDSMRVLRTSTIADTGVAVTDARTVVKTGPVVHTRTVTDSTILTDPSQLFDIADGQTDPLGLSDSQRIARRVAHADTVGVADTRAITRTLRITDTAGMGDDVSVQRAARSTRLVPDSIGVMDSRALTWARRSAVTDALGVTDAIAVQLTRAVVDPETLTDSLDVTKSGGSFRTVDELVQSSDATTVARGHSRATIDAEGITDSLAVTRQVHVTVTDGVPASDVLAMGRGFTDTLSLTDDMIGVEVGGGAGRTIDNSTGLSDEVLVILDRVVTVSDLLDVIDTRSLSRALTVPDVIRVTERFGTVPPSGTVRGVLRKGRITSRRPRPTVTAYEPKEALR